MTRIDALLSAVQRRERFADAARVLARWGLPAGLWLAAGALAGIRLLGWPPMLLWICALPVPAIVGWATLRPKPLRVTARRVDEHYGLGDQLGSALEFRTQAPTSEDPRTAALAALFAQRAEDAAAGLDPKPVVPLNVPGPRWVDGAGLVALLAAALVPKPTADQAVGGPWDLATLAQPAEGSRTGVDMAMAEPLRQNLRALTGDEDEVAAISKRMLEILDALEGGTTDRAEALEELGRLEAARAEAEQQLQVDLEEDPGMLADSVRDLADALQEHEITEEAGNAFEQKSPEDAEQALSDAAEQAEAAGAEAQEAMRKAMEEVERRLAKSAKKQAQKQSETDKALDEAERRLRKEKKRESKDPEEQERRLKKMKERVEQLRRQQKREQEAQRRLDQLRRQAKDAANRNKSASSRKQAQQKLSRQASNAARKARGARRSQQARDSLQEAKSFIRRAGKQGDGAKRRRQQFKRFSKAAKGKQGKQQGKDGKGGKGGKSTLLVEGQVGEGQPDMFMEGQGQGQGQEGMGEGDGQGEGQGQGQGEGQDQGQGLGDGIGEGSQDPLGEDRSVATSKQTVRVKAKEGRGVSRAEVIRDSSQQGFATEAYRNVYTDYRGFAQSALDNEALPAARRRAVRRYYQLIQPRE